jgi:hypothetical protein
LIAFDANVAEFVADVDEEIDQMLDRVGQGMAGAAAEMARRFREEDLSGRKADDTGLNIRTGKLKGSIQSNGSATNLEDGTLIAEVFNQDAKYWAFHEDGSGYNPKRLDFARRFETEGMDLIETEVDEAFVLAGFR